MRLLVWLLIFTATSAYAGSRVRRIAYQEDQIVKVKTALGIATIIQVPDRPHSIVLGAQDKFKVEYLDQAITIKPLFPGAKTNLYIYTDYRRYNVELATGPEAASDYVIYLENQKLKLPQKQNSLRWMSYSRATQNEEIHLKVKRLARSSEGLLLIDFELSTSAKKAEFKPEWLWLVQDGKVRPIHRLFISKLQMTCAEQAQGVMQILSSDIMPNRPLRIELRRSKTTAVVIPKVNQWK